MITGCTPRVWGKIHPDLVENLFYTISIDIRGNYSESSARPCFEPLPFGPDAHMSITESIEPREFWTVRLRPREGSNAQPGSV